MSKFIFTGFPGAPSGRAKKGNDMNRQYHGLTITISRPVTPSPSIGRGFAYFAHYRLVHAQIWDELIDIGKDYVGLPNNDETREKLVASMSGLLNDYMPPFAINVKVTE